MQGYHQVPVHLDDITKTAIITPFTNAIRPEKCRLDFSEAHGLLLIPPSVSSAFRLLIFWDTEL